MLLRGKRHVIHPAHSLGRVRKDVHSLSYIWQSSMFLSHGRKQAMSQSLSLLWPAGSWGRILGRSDLKMPSHLEEHG